MAGTTGGPADPKPDPGDINERLADVAAELAGEATFKEPSAAERARIPAAKPAPRRGDGLRGRRNRRIAAKLREPVQSASGSRQPSRGGRGYAPARRSPRAGSILVAVIVVAVLLAALFGLRKLHNSSRSVTLPRPHATSTPALPFTSADPFAHSPAEHYADGAAGILVPAAHAQGPFTAAQVGSALRTVKQLLIAAYLNPATLRGGKPTAFAALLIPQQRSMFYHDLKARPGHAGTTRGWLTSFAPGTDLVGSVVKVHGVPMTVSVTSYRGVTVLKIRVDYLFVYPVEQRGDPSSRIRVVTRTEASVVFYQWDDPGGKLEPWLQDITTSNADAQCGTTDGFVHPAFSQSGPGKTRPSGREVHPYNLRVPQLKGCHPITGT